MEFLQKNHHFRALLPNDIESQLASDRGSLSEASEAKLRLKEYRKLGNGKKN